MLATRRAPPTAEAGAFRRRLNLIYGLYTLAFIAFVLSLGLFERMGMARHLIGAFFLGGTVIVYAAIGIFSRTTDEIEYYVAGRRVPAFYNGMATGADWMSAASFIGLAGTLYLHGYSGNAGEPGGLAFVLGWTGGFCLVALLLAPYLRRFGQFTIPDFLGERYGGALPRLLGVIAAILCSFIYVVAQIYGVGLVTTHLTGVAFEIGIFLGLGGILVCSFLGGMRAVTWTQVGQYIVLIIAYSVPVVWLSVKQTGVPVPQLVYGSQLEKVTQREAELLADPREQAVVEAFAARAKETAQKLVNLPASLAAERAAAVRAVADLKAADAPLVQIQAAERSLHQVPRSVQAARETWTLQRAEDEARARPLAGMPRHGQAFAGDPDGSAAERQVFDESRRNFLALVLCLAVGTAALPHILARSYTTPSVREARESVGWTVLFVVLLYMTAPALAVLVKYEVFNVLVGSPFDQLPGWIAHWSRTDPTLMSAVDINRDGILQLGEIRIGSDVVVLATPDIAGLPYVVSAMVAAGALAAALSTADGLLLTIGNALSHDTYYRLVDPNASAGRRVTASKVLLLAVALTAASVAAQRPASILFLVSAAFSFAAAAFFPALVLGVFWRRANKWGAVCGMSAGLALTCYYMGMTQPWLRGVLGVTSPIELWWGIQPISAGVFGMALGFLVIFFVSLLTPPPLPAEVGVAEMVRYPRAA
jgi:cation/acetate symporter